MNVDFERENATDKKVVSRTLFARGNTFPQKKVITFNKNRDDFEFKVNYVEPSIPQDSKSTIMKVSLTNVAEIFDKFTTNSSVESKGIKVHFRMDESGILKLESSEASFEVEYEEIIEKDNYEQISNLVGDAISKFGSKLSSLFSGNEVSYSYFIEKKQTNQSFIPLILCTSTELFRFFSTYNDIEFQLGAKLNVICFFRVDVLSQIFFLKKSLPFKIS